MRNIFLGSNHKGIIPEKKPAIGFCRDRVTIFLDKFDQQLTVFTIQRYYRNWKNRNAAVVSLSIYLSMTLFYSHYAVV